MKISFDEKEYDTDSTECVLDDEDVKIFKTGKFEYVELMCRWDEEKEETVCTSSEKMDDYQLIDELDDIFGWENFQLSSCIDCEYLASYSGEMGLGTIYEYTGSNENNGFKFLELYWRKNGFNPAGEREDVYYEWDWDEDLEGEIRYYLRNETLGSRVATLQPCYDGCNGETQDLAREKYLLYKTDDTYILKTVHAKESVMGGYDLHAEDLEDLTDGMDRLDREAYVALVDEILRLWENSSSVFYKKDGEELVKMAVESCQVMPIRFENVSGKVCEDLSRIFCSNAGRNAVEER